MATIAQERAGPAETRLRVGSWLMGLAAAGFIAYAVVFLILSFTSRFLELGIGPEQVDVGRDEIRAFSPSLSHYIDHLHIAVAGFIAAIGAAVLFLVMFGVRRGALWAWVGAVAATVLALGISLPAHYPNGFDTLAHLGPVYVATAIFAAGAALALRGILAERRARGNLP
ncbi:MAG TPA: hypothetical protein VF097_08250 [Actinomycetota bacterium]